MGKKEKQYGLGEQIESQEYLENLGRYAVPALIDILNTHPEADFRALASQRLTINARQRLQGEFRKDLTKEQREANKKISDETESFKGQYFLALSPEKKKKQNPKPKKKSKSSGTHGMSKTKRIGNTRPEKSFPSRLQIHVLQSTGTTYHSSILVFLIVTSALFWKQYSANSSTL